VLLLLNPDTEQEGLEGVIMKPGEAAKETKSKII
jgi:hypothetical protein